MNPMNEEEINALVNSRIAERDAKRDAEAERIYQLRNPTYPPAPRLEPPSPELVAEFERILDACKGDVDEATGRVAGRLRVDVNGRPADPELKALVERCTSISAAMPIIQMGLIGNVFRNMQRQRERAKASV
jgi:hypothetical protein